MARFFIEPGQVTGNQATIAGEDAQHIARVLRLRAGDELEVVAAGRAFLARITAASTSLVTAELVKQLIKNSESPLEINLYQGLPKGDKLELIIQKATELGVSSITPVLTSRVVVKLKPQVIEERRNRWQRVALEAAKQSRRNAIPEVRQPLALSDLAPTDSRLRLIAWEEDSSPLAPVLKAYNGNTVDVFIGPEGGLSAEEVDVLRRLGFVSVSLGPRILRTETAPLAMLAVIQYQLGDLGGDDHCLG